MPMANNGAIDDLSTRYAAAPRCTTERTVRFRIASSNNGQLRWQGIFPLLILPTALPLAHQTDPRENVHGARTCVTSQRGSVRRARYKSCHDDNENPISQDALHQTAPRRSAPCARSSCRGVIPRKASRTGCAPTGVSRKLKLQRRPLTSVLQPLRNAIDRGNQRAEQTVIRTI